MENVNFIMVASVGIPFIVSILKTLLKRIKIKVRSQVIVGAVCTGISLSYAMVMQYAPADIISTMASVGGITFITSQTLYKFYEDKKKVSR